MNFTDGSDLIENISNLIVIRNFLVTSMDNLNVKLTREDVKNIQTRVAYLDKVIVEHSLKMDLSKISKGSTMVHEIKVESTEDTQAVMKKFTVNTESK
jgi:hypothetical protein